MAPKAKMLGLMLAGVMILATTGNLYAQDKEEHQGPWHHGEGWQRHDEHEGQMMAQVLNLSPDQEKQLKAIKQKQRESGKSFLRK